MNSRHTVIFAIHRKSFAIKVPTMTLIPADIQLLLFIKNKENNMQTHGERVWRFMFYG